MSICTKAHSQGYVLTPGRYVGAAEAEEVSARLKTYVYRLIDPRNGETFYVGKGKGNRVFAHIRAQANLEIVLLYLDQAPPKNRS